MFCLLQKLMVFACSVICILSENVEPNDSSVPPVIEETEAPITIPPLLEVLTSQKISEETTMAKTSFIETTSASENVATSVFLGTTETVAEESETTKNKETSSVTITTTEAVPVTEFEKEKAPDNTFAVWDSKEKICLLAKFHAVFTITYTSKGGEQTVTIELPKNVVAKGKCGTDEKSPVLSLSWDEFGYTMTFSKIPNQPDKWMVHKLSLRYDTAVPLFDGATNHGKKTAQSKDMELFVTDVGQAFECPVAKVITLYRANKKVATVSMSDLRLQPFEVEDGVFSEVNRCSDVSFESPESPVQDETVPLAVGLTLTILTLIIVLGFSIRRAYVMRKVDYNGME